MFCFSAVSVSCLLIYSAVIVREDLPPKNIYFRALHSFFWRSSLTRGGLYSTVLYYAEKESEQRAPALICVVVYSAVMQSAG